MRLFLAPDSDTTCLAPKAPEKHSHLNVAVENPRSHSACTCASESAFGQDSQVQQVVPFGIIKGALLAKK